MTEERRLLLAPRGGPCEEELGIRKVLHQRFGDVELRMRCWFEPKDKQYLYFLDALVGPIDDPTKQRWVEMCIPESIMIGERVHAIVKDAIAKERGRP